MRLHGHVVASEDIAGLLQLNGADRPVCPSHTAHMILRGCESPGEDLHKRLQKFDQRGSDEHPVQIMGMIQIHRPPDLKHTGPLKFFPWRRRPASRAQYFHSGLAAERSMTFAVRSWMIFSARGRRRCGDHITGTTRVRRSRRPGRAYGEEIVRLWDRGAVLYTCGRKDQTKCEPRLHREIYLALRFERQTSIGKKRFESHSSPLRTILVTTVWRRWVGSIDCSASRLLFC